MTRKEAAQLLRARKWLMEMDRHHYCENALCTECDTAARQLVDFYFAEKKRGDVP